MLKHLTLARVLLLAGFVTACQGPEGASLETPSPGQGPDRIYAGENAPAYRDTPDVLLISIDGYRYDYNRLYQPPNLTAFARQGVAAVSLIPGFPSDTFPNHYSIVTGMFPGTHGIVANNFFDPQQQAEYRLADTAAVTDGTWYGGTPIWSAAARAGMVSASYFWVGSEAEIAGARPTYFETYDASVPHAERIATVLDWLSFPPEYRPHFITLYFSSVDSAGHEYGPESQGVRDAVLAIDRDLETLFDGLDALGAPVDVFIVSDHGMAASDPQRTIDIDSHADLGGMRGVNLGSKIYLYSDDQARADAVYAELAASADHYRVFRAGSAPQAWHADNPGFGAIIVAADLGWTLLRRGSNANAAGGAHGYDPYLFPEMRGIFMARGPDLAAPQTIPSFSNVHIYPLIMELLGLESPPDIDGRPEVLEGILLDRTAED